MAGTGGFEPPNDDIKNRCLTTWRRPNLEVEIRNVYEYISINSENVNYNNDCRNKFISLLIQLPACVDNKL